MWESDLVTQEKKAFAYNHLLMKNRGDAFLAARAVFPNDTCKALQAASEWPLHADVIQYKVDLISEYGELHFCISKADLIMEIYDRARQCTFADDYFKGMKLVAELADYMPTNKTQVDNKHQPIMITLNPIDANI